MAAYERVQAGLVERIVRMAEVPLEMAQTQQAHRLELERQVLRSDIRIRWVGLTLGTVLAVGMVAAGVWLLANDKPLGGLAALVTAVGGLVGLFIYTDHRKRDERQQRLKYLAQET